MPPEAEQAAVEQAFAVLKALKPVAKPQNDPANNPVSDPGKRQLPKPQHVSKKPKRRYAYPNRPNTQSRSFRTAVRLQKLRPQKLRPPQTKHRHRKKQASRPV